MVRRGSAARKPYGYQILPLDFAGIAAKLYGEPSVPSGCHRDVRVRTRHVLLQQFSAAMAEKPPASASMPCLIDSAIQSRYGAGYQRSFSRP